MSRAKLLGLNIKKYREQKGLTQAELAEKLDFSWEYICRVERGQKFISLRKLFELATILEIKCSDLVDFE